MIELVHIIGVLLILLLYIVYKWRTHVLMKMPGPRQMPFIGNLHQLDPSQPHIQFTEWKEVYGDIYRINTFGEYSVIVNDLDLIREVLINKGVEFGGRPQTFRAGLATYGGRDIAFQKYCPRTQHLRKVGHWALKSYGVGMERLERVISDATQGLLDTISGFRGQPFNPHHDLHTCTCNVMTSMIVGKKFKNSDQEVKDVLTLDQLMNEGLNPVHGAELDVLPWLRFFGHNCYKTLQKATEARDRFLDEQFDNCRKSLDPTKVRGVLDALFLNQNSLDQNKNKTITGKEQFGPTGTLEDVEIKGVINDLIIAGTLTTTTALSISVLVLINHSDVLKKLHDQIDENVSRDRMPTLEDRPNLPYVDAFIFEILRYSSHVPMALPHRTLCDTTIGGFGVPKDTQVLVNTWSVHHDEKYYKDPWSFKPERFLDEGGKLVLPDHPARRNMLAFGAGRRICIGENLAKSRLFLILSALLQKFDVLPDTSSPVPSSDPRGYTMGIVLMPKPFNVRMVDRS